MIFIIAYLYFSGQLLAFWYLEREEPPTPRWQNFLSSWFWPTWPIVHFAVDLINKFNPHD